MCDCGKTSRISMKSASAHADRLKAQFGVRPQLYACPEDGSIIHVGYPQSFHNDMKPRQRREHTAVRGRRNGKRPSGKTPRWVRGRQHRNNRHEEDHDFDYDAI